ncbi:hypothetical protein CIW52_17165 [Mycolicibacterium sp. P9-64]|uniref:DUF6636 domain-containing protein n=1 Tax=Mycolicibacterium sp. P9-64 TaxID=2024612 RepID=UPI0011EF0AEA|nr:DUF6636 domain-containing protein [Mycolicibacterium sp. P9-64]KAA0082678.1 hypothetical protein CIW52_17165 [Mycolicibacterium sp. P9-64]
MNGISHRQQAVKATKLATIALAAVATAVVLPATAQADDDYQQFSSPSGNIRCLLLSSGTRTPIAMCQISDFTYSIPQGAAVQQDGAPCEPNTVSGRDIRIDQGKQAYVTCSYSAIGSGFGQWPALAYGQTRSLGALTCTSEQSGMTCADGGTGHFFRISRDSYQVG